ncbi:MAG TPA: glycoside hydrolase family 57 protein [Syntrophales bacterium]|nr:glycoside hydrolase family 57 protein [Syntrophales bacterium]
MPSICLLFHVNKPRWLKHYTFFDINHDHVYEDRERNLENLVRSAEQCYLPANRIVLDLVKRYKGAFRVAFSITGVLLDQLEKHRKDVLDSFKRLADTGCVEFVGETYYHSLASLYSEREFKEQVALHKKRIKTLFGRTPKTLRNTELVYSSALAMQAEKMGFSVIVAEGADKILGWRSPNYAYRPPGCKNLKVLLRNHRLSDDIAFHFSDPTWSDQPLSADKYADWIHSMNGTGDVINLFMNYETFGEHQSNETGILDFLRLLPPEILKHGEFRFHTPLEIAGKYVASDELDVKENISWADAERDLDSRLGNALQKDAIGALFGMEADVRRRKDPRFLHAWRMLQASEHFFYMRTREAGPGAHKYSNPYGSPYDAYINYMNIIDDFSGYLSRKRS